MNFHDSTRKSFTNLGLTTGGMSSCFSSLEGEGDLGLIPKDEGVVVSLIPDTVRE